MKRNDNILISEATLSRLVASQDVQCIKDARDILMNALDKISDARAYTREVAVRGNSMYLVHNDEPLLRVQVFMDKVVFWYVPTNRVLTSVALPVTTPGEGTPYEAEIMSMVHDVHEEFGDLPSDLIDRFCETSNGQTVAEYARELRERTVAIILKDLKPFVFRVELAYEIIVAAENIDKAREYAESTVPEVHDVVQVGSPVIEPLTKDNIPDGWVKNCCVYDRDGLTPTLGDLIDFDDDEGDS